MTHNRNAKHHRHNRDPLLAGKIDEVVYTCGKCNSGDHNKCSRYQGRTRMPCICRDSYHDRNK